MKPNPYTLPDGNVHIAFSGGRSSAYMLHEILEANGALPDRVVVSFQNTGREMPQTLDFVQEVASRWGVDVVWLEYRSADPRFVVVDHASACRDGEPFEALIRKRGMLPNQRARFCTAEMKVHASTRYLITQGWQRWSNTTGIRADEQHRLNKKAPRERWTVWTPLASAGVSKQDVTAFWARQPFDLALPNQNGKTPLGNCDGCFLKSEANIAHLVTNYPDRHAWWERMEALAATLGSGAGNQFSARYSRKEMREFMENQGALALETEGALCQQDDGECFG